MNVSVSNQVIVMPSMAQPVPSAPVGIASGGNGFPMPNWVQPLQAAIQPAFPGMMNTQQLPTWQPSGGFSPVGTSSSQPQIIVMPVMMPNPAPFSIPSSGFMPGGQTGVANSSPFHNPLMSIPGFLDPTAGMSPGMMGGLSDPLAGLSGMGGDPFAGMGAPQPSQSDLKRMIMLDRINQLLKMNILVKLLKQKQRAPIPLSALGQTSSTPVNGTAGSTPGTTPAPAPQPGTAKISKEDFVDYFLAGSNGGTTATQEMINGQFARPGSKLSTAGAKEFDAVVAYAYSGQFKAYALGLDVVFSPGEDVNVLAGNLTRALETPFTEEAEILAKVAATYRGELTGTSSKYDNAVLKQLLVKWGRSDIANQPNVGVTDVESIGGVIKAINEEPNAEIRKAWLGEIFNNFVSAGGNDQPTSPSGAVPNLQAYQAALNIVTSGQLDQLLGNFNNGIKTA